MPAVAASRPRPPIACSPTRSLPKSSTRWRCCRCGRSWIGWCASASAVTDPHMSAPAVTALDVERLRQDFPILSQRVRGKPLVYLDNAATSQKPRRVIDAVSRFYSVENANIHRGVHFLSEQATVAYDA